MTTAGHDASTAVLVLGRDPIGAITAPFGWEVSAGIWLREPETECEPAPLSPRSLARRPRAMISIRAARTALDAEQAMKRWLVEFAAELPTRILRSSSAAFEDGAAGWLVILSFDIGKEGRAAQCHVFRADRGIVTQLTASVAEHQIGRLESELLPMLLRFR
jgi:hypothetical protein